jgi:hypothetical protein
MASKYIQKFPIPDGFPEIIHDLSKEILRNQPEDIVEFCALYFKCLQEGIVLDYSKRGKNIPCDFKTVVPSVGIKPEQAILSEKEEKLHQDALDRSRMLSENPVKGEIKSEKQLPVIKSDKVLPVVHELNHEQEEKHPEKQRNEEHIPEEHHPEERKSDQESYTNEENRDEEIKPEENKPEEHKDEEIKPDEHKHEEIKPDEHKPEEHKHEENKPEEHHSEENKPEEHKPEENKPEEHKHEENRHDQEKHHTEQHKIEVNRHDDNQNEEHIQESHEIEDKPQTPDEFTKSFDKNELKVSIEKMMDNVMSIDYVRGKLTLI